MAFGYKDKGIKKKGRFSKIAIKIPRPHQVKTGFNSSQEINETTKSSAGI